MKIWICIVPLLFTFFGCKVQKQDLPGIYKERKPGYFQGVWHWLNNKAWTVGGELVLNEDSSFQFTACTAIAGTSRFYKVVN